MPIIDVHTHMFTDRFMALLKAKGGMYNLQTRPDGQVEIFRHDTPVAIPQRGHFDYELRLRNMDAGHIAQNLYLAATALNLGCCTVGAFYDEEVDRVIGVDGKEEVSVYLGAVGRIR